MEFSDKVKDVSKKVGDVAEKTYKTVADKSSQMFKGAKLKIQSQDLEDQINGIYMDLGKKVYNNYISGAKCEDFEKECKKISKLYKEIEEVESKALYIKGLRKCSNCNDIIGFEDKYCPSCGDKQSKIKFKEEKEEEKVEEIQIKICPKCGESYAPEIKFCTKCGEKLD